MARVVFSMMLALALSILAVPASAAPTPATTITIDRATPGRIATGNESVTVHGTISSLNPNQITNLVLRIAHDPTPVLNASDVDRALGSNVAKNVHEVTLPGTLMRNVPFEFAVTVPASKLGATAQEIATVAEVQLLGSINGSAPSIIALTTLFVPHEKSPREIVEVVALVSKPVRVPGEGRASEKTLPVLSGYVADMNAKQDAIVVLDPLLYNDATLLARDHPTAANFVEAVKTAHLQKRVWLLPAGNPDLRRLPEATMSNVGKWMASSAPEELSSAPTVAFTQDGVRVPGFDETITFGSNPKSRFAQRLSSSAQATSLLKVPVLPYRVEYTSGKRWATLEAETARIQTTLTRHADLLNVATQSRAHALMLAAFSANFATQDEALAYVKNAAASSFNPSDITLSVSPSFVMTEPTSQFPATIHNGSSLPVRVRVALDSDNPQRIDVTDTDVFDLGAGESHTVLISPTAEANGATVIRAQLASPSGALFGATSEVEVTATSLGRVGWIIIIASGAFVLVGTAWRIRTVRKTQAKESSESGQ